VFLLSSPRVPLRSTLGYRKPPLRGDCTPTNEKDSHPSGVRLAAIIVVAPKGQEQQSRVRLVWGGGRNYRETSSLPSVLMG